MEPEVHRGRIRAVRRRLAEQGFDALVVTRRANILYLSGFSGDSGALLIEQHRTTLFTDGRFTVQAAQETGSLCRVEISPEPPLRRIGEALAEAKARKVGFDPGRVTVAQFRLLKRAGGTRVQWRALPRVVEGLRTIKSAGEIALMRRAAALGSDIMEEAIRLLKPGVRECEIAAEVDYRMRKKGAQKPSFETIVAFGKRAALPHARPTARRLRKNELVVLDLGAILADYCCDLTRTVFVGHAPQRVRDWYQAVLSAQRVALDALQAGVETGTVDAAARGVLASAGLDRYFVHSTGHGLGLEVHEDPRLAKGQRQEIASGMVVTIEPGIYVEGVGGIRIEDDVVVHSNRTEVLTAASREFMEL